MQPLTFSSTLSALFIVSSAAAALPSDVVNSVNCTDKQAIPYASCWNDLAVADYLAAWSRETPTCSATKGDGSDCCVAEEPWSTCFLRVNSGQAGYECDSISMNSCATINPGVSDKIRTDLQPRVRYAMNAIFTVQSLFSSYNTALEHHSILATILEAFKVDPQSVSSAVILYSQLPIPLNLGLSIANVTGWGTKTAKVAALWSTALDAAPAVKEVMFGNAADNSQQLPLLITKPAADRSVLESALQHVMTNISTFIDFTSEGRFTNQDGPPIVPADRDFDIATGVHTFVLSKLMQADSYYAIPMEVVDQTTFESLSAKDKNEYYYWSPSTHRMYELRNKGSVHIDTFTLGDHIMNDSWADAQLLFDGNYNCTAAGNAGGAIVNEKPNNGGIDVSCVSQLPMYLPKGSQCPPSTQVGGKCPFGYLN
ncbi:hypothetical protein XANCAGTX0491_002143 [Xanthoria calcicola]